MGNINERLVVSCPYGRAPSYLGWYLSAQPKTDDGKTILTLQVPLVEVGVPSGLNISRDVVATLEPVDYREAPLRQTTRVQWAPRGGGPFPTFSGSISLTADESYDSSWLHLEGTYAPPLGTLGAMFDAAWGRHIAEVTAQNLLKTIGSALEKIHREAVAK